MKDSEKNVEAQQFLSGWKEVANYLGKGVRTVQRYERCFGLPVRRPAGKSRGSVLATKAELDAWVLASPAQEALYLTKPENNSQYALSATAIKKGLAEMQSLREQMAALRSEVRMSVHLLRESILCVREEMDKMSPRQNLGFDFRTKDLLNLLSVPSKGRKAN